MVVALVALIVASAGTAVAATPVAKRAIFALNAGKLQGRTLRQVVNTPGPATTLQGRTVEEIAAMTGPATTLEGKTLAEVAALPGPGTTLEGKTLAEVVAMPGPASTAAATVSVASEPFTLAEDAARDISISCPAGTKVISGGFASPQFVDQLDTRPTAEGTWTMFLINFDDGTASGTLYAVCIR